MVILMSDKYLATIVASMGDRRRCLCFGIFVSDVIKHTVFLPVFFPPQELGVDLGQDSLL